MIIDRTFIDLVEERVNNLAIAKHLGAKVEVQADGSVHARIDEIQPHHLGGQEANAINGVVLMGLLDAAMGAAAIVRLRGERQATIELSAKIMRAVPARAVTAIGSVLSASRDVVFCQAVISDENGRPAVHGTGVMKRLVPAKRTEHE